MHFLIFLLIFTEQTPPAHLALRRDVLVVGEGIRRLPQLLQALHSPLLLPALRLGDLFCFFKIRRR